MYDTKSTSGLYVTFASCLPSASNYPRSACGRSPAQNIREKTVSDTHRYPTGLEYRSQVEAKIDLEASWRSPGPCWGPKGPKRWYWCPNWIDLESKLGRFGSSRWLLVTRKREGDVHTRIYVHIYAKTYYEQYTSKVEAKIDLEASWRSPGPCWGPKGPKRWYWWPNWIDLESKLGRFGSSRWLPVTRKREGDVHTRIYVHIYAKTYYEQYTYIYISIHPYAHTYFYRGHLRSSLTQTWTYCTYCTSCTYCILHTVHIVHTVHTVHIVHYILYILCILYILYTTYWGRELWCVPEDFNAASDAVLDRCDKTTKTNMVAYFRHTWRDWISQCL